MGITRAETVSLCGVRLPRIARYYVASIRAVLNRLNINIEVGRLPVRVVRYPSKPAAEENPISGGLT